MISSLAFRWDMNRDYVVSITDLWLWIKWLACLPGNGLLGLLWEWRAARVFFEIQAPYNLHEGSFYGWPAWTLSIVVWLVLLYRLARILGASEDRKRDARAIQGTYGR